MVFVEKKNIMRWQYLEKAAFEVGLDSARLLRDFEGRARELFKDDLQLAQEMGVRSFPTLFFRNGTPDYLALRGYQPYEHFEDIIKKLVPGVQKEKFDIDPGYLFTRFQTMTNKEFAFITDTSKETAAKLLNTLYKEGKISKYESKNGIVWISKFDS